MLSAIIHKKVSGKWKRSFLPLVLGLFSGYEDADVYEMLFTEFLREVRRRSMPFPKQARVPVNQQAVCSLSFRMILAWP